MAELKTAVSNDPHRMTASLDSQPEPCGDDDQEAKDFWLDRIIGGPGCSAESPDEISQFECSKTWLLQSQASATICTILANRGFEEGSVRLH
ncbi:hypothetical protein JAAARDRAFT_43132 [Jaapia argillacea MUCL 33604]|uniref:Uncharacterized protein n=1 Tax=Jaapia argillacea MUCL 33604 TaxID=933084 RepID=A0A067PDD0_9AGAM|nr:hypothetical protein JAAARDRAFT_43132 [Jaapia argillacea MUCL 33604]